MYLSKIHIPWRQSKNSYHLHQALWKLYPGCGDEQRNFLYRVERLEKGIGTHILMQSTLRPRQSEDNPVILDWREYNPVFSSGQRLRFRLRANPVKTIKDSRKGTVEKKGKIYTKTVRVPLIHEEQQQAWLERKLQGVAQLETLITQTEPILYFRKEKEKRSGKIQHVLFDGILSITAPDAFSALFQTGIGSAKAFGCGLLTVKRV